MADMTREEVDAKLVANEARSDAQVAAILAKIDGLIARMDAFEAEMREVKLSIQNLKKTVIVTGISAVLAIVFGMAGFNAALVSNMNTAYGLGKESGQWQSDMRKDAEASWKLNDDTRKINEEVLKLIEESRKLSEENRRSSLETAALLKDVRAELDKVKQGRAPGRR